jgi:hypothetical protein
MKRVLGLDCYVVTYMLFIRNTSMLQHDFKEFYVELI